MKKLSVLWTGNDGFIIEGGGLKIAFDLILSDSQRHTPSPVQAEDLADLDIIFLSHEHADHFHEDTCSRLAKCSACRFVVPVSCVGKAYSLGLPMDRVTVAWPSEKFTFKGMRVTPERAIHGHKFGSVYSGASAGDCGYTIELDGFKIYQPGDTIPLQQQLESMSGVDLMFFSPTEHNFGIEGSVRVLEAIRPRHIIPQHFGTFTLTEDNGFWTVGYPDEVYEKLSDELKSRFHKMAIGDKIEII